MKRFACGLIITLIVLCASMVKEGFAEPRIIPAEGQVHDAAFSPDDEFIVTASSIGVQLWDSESLMLLQTIPIESSAWMIKWSPNGRWLFILSVDNEQSYMLGMPDFEVLYTVPYSLKIPRVENCYASAYNALDEFIIHPNFINFSDDSTRFAFITQDNEVIVIESASGEEVSRNSDGDEPLTIIYFVDNNQNLLTDFATFDVSTGMKIGDGLSALISSEDYQILMNHNEVLSLHLSFIDISRGKVFVMLAGYYQGLPIGQYNNYLNSHIFSIQTRKRYIFPHSLGGQHGLYFFESCWYHTPHRYYLKQNENGSEYRILHLSFERHRYHSIDANTMRLMSRSSTSAFNTHGASPYYMNPYSSDFQRILERDLDGTLSLVDLREPASGVEHFEQY